MSGSRPPRREWCDWLTVTDYTKRSQVSDSSSRLVPAEGVASLMFYYRTTAEELADKLG